MLGISQYLQLAITWNPVAITNASCPDNQALVLEGFQHVGVKGNYHQPWYADKDVCAVMLCLFVTLCTRLLACLLVCTQVFIFVCVLICQFVCIYVYLCVDLFVWPVYNLSFSFDFACTGIYIFTSFIVTGHIPFLR